MRLARTHRQLVGLVIVLLFATFSSLRTLQQAIAHNPNALVSADVIPLQQRVAPLKPFLPAHGTIGYMSDQSAASSFFRAWYATQYALAPLMFVNVGAVPKDAPNNPGPGDLPMSPAPDLIVADFQDHQSLEAKRTQMDLVVVAQADQNLVLLCRRGGHDAHGALCR